MLGREQQQSFNELRRPLAIAEISRYFQKNAQTKVNCNLLMQVL